jgi:hypothetical protein
LSTQSEALRHAMAAATTGQELNALATELAAADRAAALRKQAQADLDWAATAVDATFTPVAAYTVHTAASDWLGDIPEESPGSHRRIIAEASLWYLRLPHAVRADAQEFLAQARGAARRTAGSLQMHPAAVTEPFLDYVNFLHKRAGSGLPQIQQITDANNMPAQTPLPPDVFDNFAPPVDPINAGVSGTETSMRAPVLQELGIGGAPAPPAGHADGGTEQDDDPDDEDAEQDKGALTGATAGRHPVLVTAAVPEHGYDDDYDFFGPGNDPDDERDHHMDEMRRRAELPIGPAAAEKWRRERRNHELEYAMQTHLDAASEYGKDYADRHHPLPLPHVRTGASTLDQIQQTTAPDGVTSHPTPLPEAVAFPWTVSPNQENDAPPADGEMAQGAGAPTTGEAAYGRQGARAVTADQWHGQEWPHAAVQPDAANNPGTTPIPPTGTAAAGGAAGTADRGAEDTAATYADASSTAPDYARGYAEGYTTAPAPQRPLDEAHPGMSGPPTRPQRLSHLLSTTAERSRPDYIAGYQSGSTWQPGGPVPAFGSDAYETGLYAGLLDNPGAQGAFAERHRIAATVHNTPSAGVRIAKHARASAYFLGHPDLPDGITEHGPYLRRRTAATSTDLDTTAPGTSADPGGATPFNGPGRPPLLEGQYGAADPAGPAPYNGAEPYGAPAVPTTTTEPAGPAVVPDTGMTSPTRATAFRRTVQANLARAAAGAPLLTHPEGSL